MWVSDWWLYKPRTEPGREQGVHACSGCTHAHVNMGQTRLAQLLLSHCSLKLNVTVTGESLPSICVCHALSRCHGHSHWWNRKNPWNLHSRRKRCKKYFFVNICSRFHCDNIWNLSEVIWNLKFYLILVIWSNITN